MAAITPWNAPLVLLCYKVGRRARRRLHRRLEAGAGDADGRVHPGRVHRGCGPAAGRLQRRSGRARGRRLPHPPSRHRQDRLHGQHRGGAQDRSRRRRAARPREPRARRQVGARSSSTTPRSSDVLASLVPFSMPITGQVCFSLTRVLVPKQRKAELLDAYVDAVGGVNVGDPVRARDADGAADDGAAARARAGLHRERHRRGREARPRRRPAEGPADAATSSSRRCSTTSSRAW